ncbi:GNAT family N-acetyltransferase [Methanobacterium alcaliphilum]|uniref:GNAT family N-acetyltransferase n=1 Tax=Methanobacterium alcaliphilum TaxID=392018 RepID=UPI00200B9E01|nr:GNAT family N-acetyltransferase [Methanobacterium alcaliphilum]MCK9151407.1 GNAT family N-acetyltransferase [Methanobacterium alcaliphilum]
MNSLIIEEADISDANEILLLQKRAYKSEDDLYDNLTIPPMEQTLDEIIKEYEDHFFLKATINNCIIGSLRVNVLNSETCYVGRLIVEPDLQNQGVGSALMDEIEHIFSKYSRFVLTTGHKSKENIHFYSNKGYKIFKIKYINENLRFVYLEKIKSK